MLGICCTIIVKQFIIRTDLCVYLVHIFLNNGRKCIIVRVAGFSCLEENIRVLSGTSLYRMIRIQRIFTERINGIHISHFF